MTMFFWGLGIGIFAGYAIAKLIDFAVNAGR
jgi:hypothetical protein